MSEDRIRELVLARHRGAGNRNRAPATGAADLLRESIRTAFWRGDVRDSIFAREQKRASDCELALRFKRPHAVRPGAAHSVRLTDIDDGDVSLAALERHRLRKAAVERLRRDRMLREGQVLRADHQSLRPQITPGTTDRPSVAAEPRSVSDRDGGKGNAFATARVHRGDTCKGGRGGGAESRLVGELEGTHRRLLCGARGGAKVAAHGGGEASGAGAQLRRQELQALLLSGAGPHPWAAPVLASQAVTPPAAVRTAPRRPGSVATPPAQSRRPVRSAPELPCGGRPEEEALHSALCITPKRIEYDAAAVTGLRPKMSPARRPSLHRPHSARQSATAAARRQPPAPPAPHRRAPVVTFAATSASSTSLVGRPVPGEPAPLTPRPPMTRGGSARQGATFGLWPILLSGG